MQIHISEHILTSCSDSSSMTSNKINKVFTYVNLTTVTGV